MLNEVIDEPIDIAYEYFKGEFELLSGIKLNLYKEKQMKRRINTLIERKGLTNYDEFLLLLKSNKNELDTFIDYITINVTSFFRTSDHWKIFEDEVLFPLINNKKSRIRIWSCACSTGEEAYSIAMSILSINEDCDFEIIATDIDEGVINKAKAGIYNTLLVEEIPIDFKNKYFELINERYKVNQNVKKHVNFYKLDLFNNNNYPKDLDIIVCRNVLIYFTEEAKKDIYEGFYKSLNKNGFLFTGNAEQIIYYKVFNFLKLNNFLYYKGDR